MNPIDFYGIILCYLNNYNNEIFLEVFEKLFTNNKEILFDILLKYKSYFKTPINMKINYLNEFINFSTNKEYKEFKENGLSYFTGIHTFLKVIEQNKEKIISMKDFQPIEFPNIELETQINIKEIIGLIIDIIEFSKEKKKLLVYFTNKFWDLLLKKFSSPEKENIPILFELRKTFQEYYEFVQEIYEKKEKNKIKKQCNVYFEKDEYGYTLDQNIKNIIKEDKNIENIEIIDLIYHYDVYYSEEKYSNKIDVEIFERINFEKIYNDFINEFKKMEFEKTFKKKIEEYLLKYVIK